MVQVQEIMRKRVVTVGPSFSVADAARVMKSNRIGSVIIAEKGKPIGIVTADDVTSLVADGKSPKRVKLKDLPKRKLITAESGDNILKVTRLMIKKGIKRVPVLKGGNLVGIVTDKEILLSTPGMLGVLSERLKAHTITAPAFGREQELSGLCERCENYSDNLKRVGARWLCEDCR